MGSGYESCSKLLFRVAGISSPIAFIYPDTCWKIYNGIILFAETKALTEDPKV
jgi:hypothetical protein